MYVANKPCRVVVSAFELAGPKCGFACCVLACVCVCVWPTCVREPLPGCRSSCLPEVQWRCRCGTWFPPWRRRRAPAANSPTQSYLRVKKTKTKQQQKKHQHLSTECACGDSMSVLLLLSQLLLLASCCGTDGGASVFPQPLDERRDDGGDATCSGRQLQRRLRVVLHPVLQGALHVGFGIQQQLDREEERQPKKKKTKNGF